MKIIEVEYGKRIVSNQQLCACIGYFDGIHKGHYQLVKSAIDVASMNNYQSALITFDPDPICVIRNLSFKKHLMPLQDKILYCEKLGLDFLVIIKMTKEIMQQSPEEFVHDILIPLQVRHVVCGFDFTFGYKGAGDGKQLAELGRGQFNVSIINPIVFDNQKISSTRIIKALSEGEIELVNTLLGRPYGIKGRVVHGRKQGRKIGFPTINLDYPLEYITPKEGVYAGIVKIGNDIYRAMTNVGHNLTFNHSDNLSVESYILDFDRQIYDQDVELYFTHFLRDEIKFNSIEELVEQMKDDEKQTRDLVGVQMMKSLV